MKKAFDQTVRDIKREVNKKVLKVPSIEQKVLDSTSNEPWGPHGSLLALIAQASRNYHEYQMIMAVLWKRLNDTGKNWRHVYKALTVLEYLVAHGSERVIDEIREHSYQISTLSDFQYIDSSGKDQGNNVRKKSQNLVVLVNDKERIIEVRQKAAANKDKFRTSPGGMYRPGSYSSTGGYDDDGRYKDEDRNGYGYGKEREYNYRDDDRYGKYGDSYGRDADRYGEERYGRDGYRDDDYRERSRSIDGYGSRSRSSDRDRDRAFDDDGQSSSRGSGARADDQAHDGRRLERKPSEQNIGGPPSYEETISESRSPAHSERNGEILAAPAPGASPPAPRTSPPSNPGQANTSDVRSPSPEGQETEVFDEFDPRGPVSAAPTATSVPTASAFPTTSNNAEMDLLGSLSDVFAPNPLAIVPITSATASSEADSQANFSGSTFAATQSASNVMNQAFEDPFGDNPFKATPTDNFSAQQPTASATPFQPTMNQNAEMAHAAAPPNGDAFSGMTYSAPDVQPPSTNSHFLPQEISSSHPETDILADILPPSGPAAVASQAGFSFPSGQPPQPGTSMYGNFNSPAGNMVPLTAPHMAPQTQQLSSPNFLPQGGFPATNPSNMALQPPAGPVAQFNNGNFPQQGFTAPVVSQFSHHTPTGSTPQFNSGNFLPQQGSTVPVSSQFTYQTPTASSPQQNDVLGNLFSQGSKSSPQAALPSSAGSLAIVPQPSKDKFETKSTVWADTLSRGLVNLNISGTKTNPLADIGIDFDALNRKEKRMEKQPMTPVISTVTMGKAMGSGTGMGRAGAGALRPPSPNSMIGSGMGMGVGAGMNMGIGMGGRPGSGLGMGGGMGGYGVVHQPMGVGMGTGMNAGMNMGMMQGGQMPPPGSAMPGGYNPMMGSGGYTPQQPYGGGYR
ncbi:EPSIN/ENT-RELATED [Salix viminalis]|uniref:EPSIN/ENT-RELATED n=1 Tax=Salix viminalis TaxID=40686 RepID=A0A9Q0UFR7_SALVM|nr:EPSIN/ENT-RELATED [Salix viminalis]